MTSPEAWIARADEVLRAGGLTERENDFVRKSGTERLGLSRSPGGGSIC